MMSWVDGLIVGLGGLSIAMAICLLVFSRRSLPDVLLASFLGWWGVTGLVERLYGMVGVSPGLESTSFFVFRLVLFGLLGSFAVVYPNLGVARLRLWTLVGVAASVLLLIVVVLFTPLESRSALARDLLRPLMALTYVAGLAILSVRWLRSPPGGYRNQVAWALLVFVFWCLHDGLGLVWYGLVFGHAWASSLVFSTSWSFIGGVMWGIGVLMSLGVMGIALKRLLRGTAGSDDRYIALLAPYVLALTTVQFFDPAYVLGGPGSFHVAMDYMIVMFVVYGVLRFNVVDIDLKMRWGVKQGTVAASLVAVFFVVSELAKWTVERYLAGLEGVVNPTLVGILAAGLLLFALAPLQRIGQRVADVTIPVPAQGDVFLAYRRMQIYRTALEGALHDGVVNPSEARSLQGLRQELGLTKADHELLEKEIHDHVLRRPEASEVPQAN